MRNLLRFVHFIALAVFLGSVGGHILLGALTGEPGSDAFLTMVTAKRDSATYLTLPALAVTLASGTALALSGPGLTKARWLRLKVGLAVLVTLNGALLLAPLAERIAAEAARPAPMLAASLRQESVFGAINLALVLTIFALAVFRPRLGAK